jgi:hypothetical protein
MSMTDTKEPIVVEEALKIIDQGLIDMLQRQLVSTNEVADLLLDVRTLLTTTADATATVDD